MTEIPAWVGPALKTARVARLATIGADGRLGLVPICFAIVDERLVSAVDHKPKRTAELSRLDDIRASGVATVLIDHYDDDWTQLWWVRIRGVARVHSEEEPFVARARAALVDKYAQYRVQPPVGPVYSVECTEIRAWRFRASGGNGS